MIHDLFFYLFSALTLLCGALVVFNPFSRSPVTSAMFLVLSMMSLAGLFVLLNAFFLAAVQVIVYAGAVIVLFLFVIMLLNLDEESRRRIKLLSLGVSLLAVGALASLIVEGVRRSGLVAGDSIPTLEGSTSTLGEVLFTQYLLPFEVVSVLLLVAMIGVILLSKKDLK